MSIAHYDPSRVPVTVYLGHSHIPIRFRQKIDVSQRDQSHEFTAELTVVCHRHPCKSIVLLDMHNIGNGAVSGHHDGIDDETLLVFLGDVN